MSKGMPGTVCLLSYITLRKKMIGGSERQQLREVDNDSIDHDD